MKPASLYPYPFAFVELITESHDNHLTARSNIC